MTVWDNPKTVAISRKGELIVWNSIFGQVALDYRFAPELCWPRSGNQKGAVENLVGWVKGLVTECPQQRSVVGEVDVVAPAVDGD